MTESSTTTQSTSEERRRNQVRSVIFGYGEDALLRLHNNRDVVNTHILTRTYMRDMVEHCLGKTMLEINRRMQLRDMAEVLAEELDIPLDDAKLKVGLFAGAIDKAAAIAMHGEMPEQTIECGAHISRRRLLQPMLQTSEEHRSLTDAQVDLMLTTLLPQTLTGENHGSTASVHRAALGRYLPRDVVEKYVLDEMKGPTDEHVRHEQLDVLRANNIGESPEEIQARYTLYKIQYAAEAVVRAIEMEAESKQEGNVRQMSQRQVKPAKAQLVRVLTEVSNWDKSRAAFASNAFEAGIRRLSANEKDSPQASHSR